MADQEYTPIRVNTLRGDLQIPFDVYVRVAGKFILYCRQGSSFEGTRLERLKSKKLKEMYVKKDDEIAFGQYLETSIDSAFNKQGGKAWQIRAEVIQGFQQDAAERFLDDPSVEFSFHHMVSSVDRFVNLVKSENEAIPALLAIPNTDRSITHHGVNVSTLATAMATLDGVKDQKLLTSMALGCLLHDVEHYYSGLDVGGNPADFPEEDKAKFNKHPIEGARRLQNLKLMDGMVLNIISQHEEHIDGTGFPKGLKEKEMDPLVMIVATANAYDRLVRFENLDPKTALKTLFIDKLGSYPLKALQNLQTVLKTQGIV